MIGYTPNHEKWPNILSNGLYSEAKSKVLFILWKVTIFALVDTVLVKYNVIKGIMEPLYAYKWQNKNEKPQ